MYTLHLRATTTYNSLTGATTTYNSLTGATMTYTHNTGASMTYILSTGTIKTYDQTTQRSRKVPADVVVAPELDTGHSEEEPLPWWDGGQCRCDGRDCTAQVSPPETSSSPVSLNFSSAGVGGTCGRRAWAAGGGQRVVSFSLYGDNPEYWVGLDDILSQVTAVYPGWRVRLYTDPRGRDSVLCPLLGRHAHFDVCDITNLPPPLGNLSLLLPSMWRLSPLGDPQVAAIMVRDLDSAITDREANAVKEWLSSEKVFHVMRDHPLHDIAVMAGMWGARWDGDPARKMPTLMATLRDTLFTKGMGRRGYFDDQFLLTAVVYPTMKGQVMAHDSYLCGRYENDSKPWPTQRQEGAFVGARRYKKQFQNEIIRQRCPRECRPPEHPGWLYC
ncbi:hypothetical protein Hamer_G019100 [Homarus americanus]|uniref:Uncharacterized protein n=2 Tax=Homarus americanus TaxID=6706 RepID=A0A8J5JT92_HOMAM|nr:hypothetical protein Hamer_G019100 [Homarus americanus]